MDPIASQSPRQRFDHAKTAATLVRAVIDVRVDTHL